MALTIEVEMPDDLSRFRLPHGLQKRLQTLLNLQDAGHRLTDDERQEAEGLVNVADLLTLLKLRSERAAG